MGFGLQNRNGVGIGLGSLSSLYCNPVGNTPSLNLNFLGTNTLDPRITFTRASSATYVNGSGLIASATTNTPRFDYDPVTLQPKGLLIEEQRTNLLTYSSEFDNAAWSKLGGAITANAASSPDGAVNADSLTEDTSNGLHIVYRPFSITSGTVYTLSYWAKRGVGFRDLSIRLDNGTSTLRSFVNLATGAVSANALHTVTAKLVGSYWYVTCTVTATATTSVVVGAEMAAAGNVATYTGNGTSSIDIWGAQLEAGAFATSYIPTVAAQVTRAADNAVMTGTNFSSWYNQAEGSFYAEILARGYVINEMLFSATDGTVTNPIQAYFDSATQIQTNAWGNGTVFRAATVGTKIKYALGIAVNNLSVTIDGAAVTSDTSVGPAVSYSQFNIGNRNSTLIFNGHIRSITYWPRRLSNTELQAITV